MDILWDRPGCELTGRVIADELPGYAYTTVATVLDRLVHKDLVHRRMEHRAIQFSATGSRADHTAHMMHEALVTTREPDAILVRFAETLSDAEAAVLLDRLEVLGKKPSSRRK